MSSKLSTSPKSIQAYVQKYCIAEFDETKIDLPGAANTLRIKKQADADFNSFVDDVLEYDEMV